MRYLLAVPLLLVAFLNCSSEDGAADAPPVTAGSGGAAGQAGSGLGGASGSAQGAGSGGLAGSGGEAAGQGGAGTGGSDAGSAGAPVAGAGGDGGQAGSGGVDAAGAGSGGEPGGAGEGGADGGSGGQAGGSAGDGGIGGGAGAAGDGGASGGANCLPGNDVSGLLCDACISNNATDVLPSYPANFILSTPDGDVDASILDGEIRQDKGFKAKVTDSCGLYLSQASFSGEIHIRISSLPGKETNAGATIYFGKNGANPCGAVTSGGVFLAFLGSYEKFGDFQTTPKIGCSDLGAFSGACPAMSESDVFVCAKCDTGQTLDSNCALKVNQIKTKIHDIGTGLFGRAVQRRLYAIGRGHCPGVASDATVSACPVPGFPPDLL